MPKTYRPKTWPLPIFSDLSAPCQLEVSIALTTTEAPSVERNFRKALVHGLAKAQGKLNLDTSAMTSAPINLGGSQTARYQWSLPLKKHQTGLLYSLLSMLHLRVQNLNDRPRHACIIRINERAPEISTQEQSSGYCQRKNIHFKHACSRTARESQGHRSCPSVDSTSAVSFMPLHLLHLSVSQLWVIESARLTMGNS